MRRAVFILIIIALVLPFDSPYTADVGPKDNLRRFHLFMKEFNHQNGAALDVA